MSVRARWTCESHERSSITSGNKWVSLLYFLFVCITQWQMWHQYWDDEAGRETRRSRAPHSSAAGTPPSLGHRAIFSMRIWDREKLLAEVENRQERCQHSKKGDLLFLSLRQYCHGMAHPVFLLGGGASLQSTAKNWARIKRLWQYQLRWLISVM